MFFNTAYFGINLCNVLSEGSMKFLINFNLFSLNANCSLTQCDVSQLVAIHIHFVDVVLLEIRRAVAGRSYVVDKIGKNV